MHRSRTLLALLLLSCIWLFPGASLHAEQVSAADLKKLPPHPRLFAKSEDWRRLREQVKSDPVSKQLFEAARLRADLLLKAPPVVYAMQGRRLLGPIRYGEGRIISLAMAAKLTGKQNYLDRAKKEMLALAALPSWNPSHFLDVGEATLALAIGYDWLYDELSQPERNTIRNAILEKGIKVSLKTTHWVNKSNNWNQVCHTGIVMGALAIAPDEPEIGAKVINRALEKIPIAAKEYAPDGAYVEGPLYWGYGTSFHVMLIDALSSSLGSTYDLEKFPGFMESSDYMVQMLGPGGEYFNYSDSVPRKDFNAAMFWFARARGNPSLATQEIAFIPQLCEDIRKKVDDTESGRFFQLALLWWKPAAAKPGTELPLRWSARGSNPVAVQRTSWTDPNAAYVAIKAGKANSSHGHMDAGSFILECDGVRWALDVGPQGYGRLEAMKIDLWNFKDGSDRWRIFRLGPDGHNLLRFNNALPLVNASVKIVESRDTANGALTLLDGSALYPTLVSRMQRGVKLASDRTVWIQDEWTAKDDPLEVTFNWLTRAKISVQKETVTLRQQGKTLVLQVVEPAGARIEVEDVSKPRKPFDEANRGMNRIVIHTRTPADGQGRIAILVTPGEAAVEKPGVGTAVTPLDSWK